MRWIPQAINQVLALFVLVTVSLLVLGTWAPSSFAGFPDWDPDGEPVMTPIEPTEPDQFQTWDCMCDGGYLGAQTCWACCEEHVDACMATCTYPGCEIDCMLAENTCDQNCYGLLCL